MERKNDGDIFSATNPLKILAFLSDNPGKEFLGRDIQKATSLSRAGIYIALRELIQKRLVGKTQKGKFLVYSVIYNDPIVRQFKVLRNIISLRSVTSKLMPIVKKVVLYGSTARGEDSSISDVDLFILSGDIEPVKRVLSSLKTKRKVKAVLKTPSELVEFKQRDKVFYEEVERGIVLWEKKE